jgi:hypothetical protein
LKIGPNFFLQHFKNKPKADPLNLKPQAARPEISSQTEFVEAWNMVPGVIKRSKTVNSFKNAYRRHREIIVENA